MNKPTQKSPENSTETQNLNEIDRSLENVPPFAELGSNDLQKLEKGCHWLEFKRNARIIQKRKENTDVYILVSGAAHVLNYSDKGRVIDYATLGPGDVFGEPVAIDGLPRSGSVVTIKISLIASSSGG